MIGSPAYASKSGGNEQQVGLECEQCLERALDFAHMVCARGKWRDRKIVNVCERTLPSSRISRETDGLDANAICGLLRHDRFGAVAVVRIEIPDRDALCAIFERVERGDGDIAEITKSHRAIARTA